MIRAGVALLALASAGASPASGAETCSLSTLASPTYASARWCGDPARPGTLRVARRDGPAMDYAAVPVDVFRELVRTHAIAAFLLREVEPRYRRTAGPPPVQPAAR